MLAGGRAAVLATGGGTGASGTSGVSGVAVAITVAEGAGAVSLTAGTGRRPSIHTTRTTAPTLTAAPALTTASQDVLGFGAGTPCCVWATAVGVA